MKAWYVNFTDSRQNSITTATSLLAEDKVRLKMPIHICTYPEKFGENRFSTFSDTWSPRMFKKKRRKRWKKLTAAKHKPFGIAMPGELNPANTDRKKSLKSWFFSENKESFWTYRTNYVHRYYHPRTVTHSGVFVHGWVPILLAIRISGSRTDGVR